ncbi:helix-turn-helix domain-containing protein [Nocardiopsis sp. NPDC007018]|uniref:TetR/AcrR family transcriptional regulator n=1 Tax=Nocardiopsis sp. NPDC007018 TaxID=3155721 RepID=UPI00340774B9
MDTPRRPASRVPRAQVRGRLLTAAAGVFSERGHAHSRVDDVARAAGFTKGAVHSDFGGKQDLFAAVLSERSEQESASVAALVTDLPARHGVRFTAAPETVALAPHCHTNGLSMEHLADPEAVDARTIEEAPTTALAGFAARPQHEETP